jgi:hypothetical protein
MVSGPASCMFGRVVAVPSRGVSHYAGTDVNSHDTKINILTNVKTYANQMQQCEVDSLMIDDKW